MICDTDIVVAGISLHRLVEVCGTPSVHSAASVLPESGQRPAADASTAVLVVRVLSVAKHNSGARVVQVDARLDNLRLVWSEIRRVGGGMGARTKLSLVVRRPGAVGILATTDVLAVDLPVDLAVGDLLAVPSRSIPARFPRQLHPLTGRSDWKPNPVLQDALTLPVNWWETIE
jgi:hypothetical protein